MSTSRDSRPVFSKGAIIAWGRSIGVPDAIALEFFRQEGAIIKDNGSTVTPITRSTAMNEGYHDTALAS
jgi:hypothetical protein